MVQYYKGTWLEDDGDGNYTSHEVVWVHYKADDTCPEEWILMEVDGKEEHFCDPEKWAAAEKELDIASLRIKEY